MNWSSLTFDWNQIRAFLVTAEEGSLSAAARALGMTQPTLSRQVSALEQDLGVVLFDRVGRGLVLAPAGAELLEHVRRMGQAAQHVSLVASGYSQNIEGSVRITASDVMSAYVLPPFIAQLRKRAPRLKLEVDSADDLRDLMRREADIAIRHVRPDQPDLVARLVRHEKAYIYGSTEYLNTHGRPKTIADLAHHDFIGFGDDQRMVDYMVPLGIPVTTDSFPVGSSNGIACLELGCQGLGLIPISEDIATLFPQMEKVASPTIEFPVWLTTHREIHTSRKIRLVFDMLAEFLGGKTMVQHPPARAPTRRET